MIGTAKSTARITVLETSYYQSADTEPKSSEKRFTRLLEQDEEQPYGPRKMTITDEWKPLDTGWIETASFYCIENLEGRFTQTIPTQEEREAALLKTIELAIQTPSGTVVFCTLPPGEFQRVGYRDIKRVRVRCLNGPAKAVATIYPE